MRKFIFPIVAGIFLIGYYLYKKPKFKDGQIAAPINFQLQNGNEFSLDELKGSFVLIDFWGSWCGPCRVENPGLVDLYNTFHDKEFKNAENFEILSIAAETSEKAWKNAIIKDGLYWPYHYSDFLRLKSPIFKSYGVREIPTKYLIDPEGYVISVNAKIDELRTTLTQELK